MASGGFAGAAAVGAVECGAEQYADDVAAAAAAAEAAGAAGAAGVRGGEDEHGRDGEYGARWGGRKEKGRMGEIGRRASESRSVAEALLEGVASGVEPPD